MLTLCSNRGSDQVFRLEDEVRDAGAAYRFGEIDTEERKEQENVPGLPKKDFEELAGCVARYSKDALISLGDGLQSSSIRRNDDF
jgi:hypothetical protein